MKTTKHIQCCCENCEYWAQPELVCVNANSDMVADFTDRYYTCSHWVGKGGNIEHELR
jgi:hypothetical protein